MEHAGQALVPSNRKGTKPEESAPSCAGKISRTGEQSVFPWELLPTEMVVSIFNLLSHKDLLACRAVCKRFVVVIDAISLLDKAKAFCKRLAQPPAPALFGKDRYIQVLRPWFEAFFTAQQRLTGGASDDLQFPDGKREETEGQASPEHNEQVQAIQLSQLEQLDRLMENEEFPKALFFIHAKTLQNAESLYWQGKVSHFFCSEIVQTVCFSPDGRGLVIPFGNAIRFVVLDGKGNVVRQNVKRYDTPVEELRFSPNGRSLVAGFRRITMIMGFDGEDWVQKGQIISGHSRKSVCFNPDSDGLAAVFYHSVQIMGRDKKGNWVQNSEIATNRFAQTVSFSPDSSGLAVSDGRSVWYVGRDEKGNWVLNHEIRSYGVKAICFSPNGSSMAISNVYGILIMGCDEKSNQAQCSKVTDDVFTSVQSVQFSPDGGSLAILGRKAARQSILIMRSDGEGSWVQNFMIPCVRGRRCLSICFSPDGRNLMLEPFLSQVQYIIGLDIANSRVYMYEPFPLNLGGSTSAFSPSGRSLAVGCDSTTWVMGLDKGKWVKQACIPGVSSGESVSPSPLTVEGLPLRCDPNDARGGSVRAVYFSPDSRRLAIISAYGSSECPNSQVSIYEIKTGAKVLTDLDNQFLKGFFPS